MGAYGGSEQADLGRMARGGNLRFSKPPRCRSVRCSTVRSGGWYEYEEGAGPPWYEQVTRLGVLEEKREHLLLVGTSTWVR